MFIKTQKQPAHVVYENCLTEYGLHALQSKIPHLVDGLKSVQRRVLLTHPSSETPKVVSITGKVLDRYHPYGDASISGTIIRMAQPHNTFVTLMHSNSNVGDYGGGEAAAPRYMEICASDLALFMYFNNIDQSVFEFQPTEVGDGKEEPKYMVPKIPMALVVASFGIAFGHSSDPANLCLGSVCQMTEKYVKMLKKHENISSVFNPYPALAEYAVPDFPIYQYIRNWDALIASYKKKNFSIPLVLDGSMEVYPNKIIIRTMPYGVYPKDVWDKLGSDRRQTKPNLINQNIAQIEDYSHSSSQCELILTFKRGVNVFELLEPLKNYIGFTKKWTPRYLFILPNGKVDYVDPVQVLELWYQERTRCIRAELASGQHRLIKQMRVLEALIKIGSRIKEVVDLLLKVSSSEEAVPMLCKTYQLNKAQAYAILGYRLSNIPKKDRQTLVQQRKDAVDKLNKIQTQFLNADQVVIEDCLETSKRFSEYNTRNSFGDQFLGAVLVEDGIIQFDTLDEAMDIVGRFGNIKSIICYSSEKAFKCVVNNTGVRDNQLTSLPKEMQGEAIYVGSNRPVCTLLRSSLSKVSRIDRLCVSTRWPYTHVSNTVFCIKNNQLMEMSVDEIPITTENKIINSIDLQWVSPKLKGDLVVVYTNKVNVFCVKRIAVGETLELPTKTQILALDSTDHPMCFTIPERWRSKTGIQHVLLRNLAFVPKNEASVVFFTHKTNTIPNSKVKYGVLYN